MAATKKVPFFLELTDGAGNAILIRASSVSAIVRDEEGYTVLVLDVFGENMVAVSETYEQVKEQLVDTLNNVN